MLTGAYKWAFYWITGVQDGSAANGSGVHIVGRTLRSTATATQNPSAQKGQVSIAGITVPTGVIGWGVCRTLAGGSTYFLVPGSEQFQSLVGTMPQTYVDNTGDGSLVTGVQSTNTTGTTLAGASSTVQHNGSLVAAEPNIDFEDGTGVVFTVADDGPNRRVKVTPSINVAAGTSFPGSPVDGQEYIYAADTTNGVFWRMRWYASGGYWACVGGSPLFNEIATAESTNSGSYTALTTAGPSIVLPFAGDWMVWIGCTLSPADNASQYMSYDIGGTGAVDADGIRDNSSIASISRLRRKTGLGAVTLTAKYKGDTGNPATWENRFMAVWPVKK